MTGFGNLLRGLYETKLLAHLVLLTLLAGLLGLIGCTIERFFVLNETNNCSKPLPTAALMPYK